MINCFAKYRTGYTTAPRRAYESVESRPKVKWFWSACAWSLVLRSCWRFPSLTVVTNRTKHSGSFLSIQVLVNNIKLQEQAGGQAKVHCSKVCLNRHFRSPRPNLSSRRKQVRHFANTRALPKYATTM
jgi:hypothetical protein